MSSFKAKRVHRTHQVTVQAHPAGILDRPRQVAWGVFIPYHELGR